MAEAQLSERDKSIVGLIDKLAELASDEVTTKDTIDNIMSTIKTKTRENIRAEMDEAKNPPPKTKMEFPGGELTNDIRSSVMQELERMKLVEKRNTIFRMQDIEDKLKANQEITSAERTYFNTNLEFYQKYKAEHPEKV